MPKDRLVTECPLGCGEDECRQPQPCHLSDDADQRNDADTLLHLLRKYPDVEVRAQRTAPKTPVVEPIKYEELPVPDECERTIKHVLLHLHNADQELVSGDGVEFDMDQVRHELSIAIRLLEEIEKKPTECPDQLKRAKALMEQARTLLFDAGQETIGNYVHDLIEDIDDEIEDLKRTDKNK